MTNNITAKRIYCNSQLLYKKVVIASINKEFVAVVVIINRNKEFIIIFICRHCEQSEAIQCRFAYK